MLSWVDLGHDEKTGWPKVDMLIDGRQRRGASNWCGRGVKCGKSGKKDQKRVGLLSKLQLSGNGLIIQCHTYHWEIFVRTKNESAIWISCSYQFRPSVTYAGVILDIDTERLLSFINLPTGNTHKRRLLQTGLISHQCGQQK